MEDIKDKEKFNDKYRIKSTRLPFFDYSSNGIYFITICTLNKNNFFGKIKKDEVLLSEKGKIVEKYWKEIPKHYPQIILDEFCIMPNHIHGLIQIKNVETTNLGVSNSEKIKNNLEEKNLIGLQKWKLSLIARTINQFKRATTIEMKNKKLFFGWQTRFFDQIIKNERHHFWVRQYIKDNPKNFKDDINFKI